MDLCRWVRQIEGERHMILDADIYIHTYIYGIYIYIYT
jgi:hypothetical protein